MHDTLTAIQKHLRKLIAQVQSQVPNDEPFGNAHNNWSFPGLTRAELIDEAQSIIDLIDGHATDDLGAADVRLNDYLRRLQHLSGQTVTQMWGNAGQAVSAYMLTLEGLRKALEPVLKPDGQKEAIAKLRKLNSQLRGMEARLRDLEPRTVSLSDMVGRIEQAYEAADQLPADLESLSEARQKIVELERAAGKDHALIGTLRENAESHEKQLKATAHGAEAVLERCESAYSAATSVGLAAAFTERSGALSRSMWAWVIGLVVALSIGGWLGTSRLHALAEMIRHPAASPTVVTLNVLLSVLSIGAPVWFAWLATKQIGQRFRLAEDYAFKASVSRAYEGYRREAARIDADMEARLLGSALDRLDELPLRLVEANSHGSPFHELVSSELVQQALKGVPGFTEQVKDLAARAISTVGASAAAVRPNARKKFVSNTEEVLETEE